MLLIGSGPIVIGQACEFDYSGTQAVKALREEGLRLVLVNSNPATIMTDPDLADRTYIEPMTVAVLTKIIERERPDAILPTVGGQTALNLAIELAEAGVLDRFKCELIGAKLGAIKKAEDRDLFKQAMLKIGLEVPRSSIARSAADGERVLGELGLPVIIRPSRTLGGTGGSIARELGDYRAKLAYGLEQSPSHEVLIEQSVEGWKEFELEVMRDTADNVVIICSIENLDPMGVHTGDSITVAPAQTLTDKEYQIMRDAAIRIIREIGVDTGGSNIQFAIEPSTGRMVVIEMNPRVSRSSALASKATGFPIAKIAARLAVGYRLDEIPNDITRMTPSCFEPTIDYVVTKIPRFTFEKFRGAADELGPQMKSVGEAMAIGRTFKESLQKALRSLEIGSHGLESGLSKAPSAHAAAEIRAQVATASSHRLYHLADALRLGITRAEVYQLSKIDPWFIDAIAELVAEEKRVAREPLGAAYFREFKPMGFSDRRIAELRGIDEAAVASARREAGVNPVFKSVDTCGAEFEAFTPYLYSTYEGEDEAPPTARKKVIILGGGPNRIGQGIEFDYCCVHASLALKAGRLRNDHGELQPRDGLDRLRHLGSPLLRAADVRGRDGDCGARETGRRNRAVRRADAAQARGAAGAGGRADSRDESRRDRPRGGSRAIQRDGGAARAAPARGRAGARAGGCDRGRSESRVPGADPAVVRAGRPRDGGDPERRGVCADT